LQISSFPSIFISETEVILKAQSVLNLTSSSLSQEALELNLLIGNIRVEIFSSLQIDLQNISILLSAITGNLNNNATLLSNDETAIFIEVVANLSSTLQTLGKNINKNNHYI
jgi:hypothetical protein